MDILKIIQLGIDYLSDYFMALVLILRYPKIHFEPVIEPRSAANVAVANPFPEYRGTKLNPKIFGFMAISIFIGSLFMSFFPTYANLPPKDALLTGSTTYRSLAEPQQPTTFDTLESISLIVANWFFSSLVVYLICWLLRVRIDFWEFTTVFLQLQAALYVISNFIALVWAMLGNSIAIFVTVVNFEIRSSFQNPAIAYYAIHLVLSLIYFPLALRSLRKIHPLKLLIIDLVPAVWLTMALLPLLRYEPYIGDPTLLQYMPQMAIFYIIEISWLRIGAGLLISITFIVALLMAMKRLKSKYSI